MRPEARARLGRHGLWILGALLLGLAAVAIAGLAGDDPLRGTAAIAPAALVAYLATLPWCTGQRPPDGYEPYYLLVAHSLAFDGDTDLRNNYAREDSLRFMPRALEPQPGDPVGADGEIYSRHSALVPLALAFPYRLAGARGVFVVMAGLIALLAWWFLRVCGRDRPDRPGEALLVWALLTFAPPVLLYSHQVWIEIPAALLLLAGGGPASTARFRIRILEMEDPPAVTEGGRLHPRQWAVDRVRRSSGIILIVVDRGVLEL